MDYSVSGAFGEVRFYKFCIPSDRFRSVDHVRQAGWHSVNELYCIDRPEGGHDNLLLLTRSGSGQVRIADKKYVATPGTVAVIPRGVRTTYHCAYHEKWEFYWVHYYGDYTQNVTEDILRNGQHILDLGLNNSERLFTQLTGSYVNSADSEIVESDALGDLLRAILRLSVQLSYSNSERQFIRELIEEIDRNYTARFSLNALSQKYHYSKEYLIRLFKKPTGTTPYHYHKLHLLKRSCIALAEGELTIGEIALLCGYRHVGSYSAAFKECLRISPAEYRKQYSVRQN